MNLAIIGSGGREHAICYKLSLSKKIDKLICIPGNAGTQEIAENINEDISDFEIVSNFYLRSLLIVKILITCPLLSIHLKSMS